jgi:multidrug efflux system membrane fusion protein
VVAEGLNVGDKIVVAGQSRLFDGAFVVDKPLAAPNASATDGVASASRAAKTGADD